MHSSNKSRIGSLKFGSYVRVTDILILLNRLQKTYNRENRINEAPYISETKQFLIFFHGKDDFFCLICRQNCTNAVYIYI